MTSSNNGAAVNISRDLPKRNAVATPAKNEDGTIEDGVKNDYDRQIAEYLKVINYYPSTAKKLR